MCSAYLVMPGPIKPTPPFGTFAGRETDALWRARDEDRAEVKERFTRLEDGVKELHVDVSEVKMSVNGILDTEKQRAASAEKRDNRIWQVGSGVLVALLVAAVIALWKVFAPIAITGASVKPPTVNEQLDNIQHEMGTPH